MLTLFSIPKAFRGAAAVIQRNALGSWVRLSPRCEVVLIGDDEGVAEAAREFGARHIPEVVRNERGTPLLSSAFAIARKKASHRILGYANADIILQDDFPAAVRRIPFRRYLMVGRRWDLDVPAPIDYGAPDWTDRLRRAVREQGTLQPPVGCDYFVFPAEPAIAMPPFAVGRPGWDNWFIYRARSLGIPVVDATPSVTAVHQNHGYGHVKDGVGHSWEGPEAEGNRELIGGRGGWDRIFIIDDASHVLHPDRLARADTDDHLRWRLERRPDRHPRQRVRNRLLADMYRYRHMLPEPLWRRLFYVLA